MISVEYLKIMKTEMAEKSRVYKMNLYRSLATGHPCLYQRTTSLTVLRQKCSSKICRLRAMIKSWENILCTPLYCFV